MKQILILIAIAFSCLAAQANTNDNQSQMMCGEFQGPALSDSELTDMSEYFNNNQQYCEDVSSDVYSEAEYTSGFIKVSGRKRAPKAHRGNRAYRGKRGHRAPRRNRSYHNPRRGYYQPRYNAGYGRRGGYYQQPYYGNVCRNGYNYCFMIYPEAIGYGCICPGFYGTVTYR